MTHRHSCITSYEAQPGMRLSKPINHVRHHRLFALPEGTELSEQLIERMIRLEVPCLFIERRDDRNPEEQAQSYSHWETRLRSVFVAMDLTQEPAATFYAAVLRYRAEYL